MLVQDSVAHSESELGGSRIGGAGDGAQQFCRVWQEKQRVRKFECSAAV